MVRIFIPKIRRITVQMGTSKAYLYTYTIFFEILAAFFEFIRKKQVVAKSFCPRGQQAFNPPSPHVDKHGFFENPLPPLLSTWFIDAALMLLNERPLLRHITY